ncbi:hypothetical protein [Oceanirhabdus sp. W0125-5]|uniref:hypothetical protein n=1 Tax=Oceanirhabdus sp. W0125-5 TaxID=2999116 RepID=UPI0022F2E3B9|nr:hypothetical protein [Oceanirhabdus sp. W0125-5]WBW95753.1 hypothetical protein OW730_18930 [Oceanirhabdus sp. W0125-5]
MRLAQIKELLNASFLTDIDCDDVEFKKIFACDLMSDVLALVDEDVILVTGLINIQTIRTAEMKDIKCVIFVRGKEPANDVVKLARDKEIILLKTTLTLFESCGTLYNAGMKGIDLYE